MKVIVDFDTCMTNGECVLAAPEVFQLNSDAVLEVLDEHPDESLREQVEHAVLACPTQAIRIEE